MIELQESRQVPSMLAPCADLAMLVVLGATVLATLRTNLGHKSMWCDRARACAIVLISWALQYHAGGLQASLMLHRWCCCCIREFQLVAPQEWCQVLLVNLPHGRAGLSSHRGSWLSPKVQLTLTFKWCCCVY